MRNCWSSAKSGDLTGRTVTEATVTNAELLPDLIGTKKPRMDVNCVFDGGQRADIELQLISQKDDQRLRSLYYASRLYSSSIREGELYKRTRKRAFPFGNALVGYTITNYLKSESTFCEDWFACASIAVPACWRTLFFVNSTISAAMSVSRILDSEA